MKKTGLVFAFLLLAIIAISQTKSEYDKLKVDFYLKALNNSTSCEKISQILSDKFNMQNMGSMCIFKHKDDESMSFMYKEMGENCFMYTWTEKENRLSDFRVLYDKNIQQLGFVKIIDKTDELTYRLCDKKLILTITFSSYTGKVSCDLFKCPEHALIKYACQ